MSRKITRDHAKKKQLPMIEDRVIRESFMKSCLTGKPDGQLVKIVQNLKVFNLLYLSLRTFGSQTVQR